MTNKDYLRRLMNFFNTIGILSDDNNLDSIHKKHVLKKELDFALSPHVNSNNCFETRSDIENDRFTIRGNNLKALNKLNNVANSSLNNNNTNSGTTSHGAVTLNRSRHQRPSLLENGAACYNFSTLKLRKLKTLILDQAKELRKQSGLLDEKSKEIDRLKTENESLRRAISQLKKEYHSISSTNGDRQSSKRDLIKKRRKCSSENGNGKCPDGTSKEQLEIISLSPTSSKIRRVRSDANGAEKRAASKCSFSRKIVADKSVVNSDTHCTVYEANNSSTCVPVTKDISIPTWSTLTFLPSGVLEGTEDITDDAYAKRHHKYYLEEKRLVRRDKMRERDLEMYRRKSSVVSYLNNNNNNSNKTPSKTSGERAEPVKANEIEAIVITDKIQKCTSLPPFNIPHLPDSLSVGRFVEKSKRKRRR